MRFVGGKPQPLGVRAAATKMALIVAETEKGTGLTTAEARYVTAVAAFFADEYERISTDNEHCRRDIQVMKQQILELEARVLDLAEQRGRFVSDEEDDG